MAIPLKQRTLLPLIEGAPWLIDIGSDGNPRHAAMVGFYTCVVHYLHGNWHGSTDAGELSLPHHRRPTMDEGYRILSLGEIDYPFGPETSC